MALGALSPAAARSSSAASAYAAASRGRVVSVPESAWRRAASEHRRRVRSLLGPGLTPSDHRLNSGSRRRRRERRGEEEEEGEGDGWTALDPRNPVYNFLIEYYGIKGGKGPRRLARWSPDPALILRDEAELTSSGLGVHSIAPSAEGSVAALAGGVLLEGATVDDIGGALHLRGGTRVDPGRIGGGGGGRSPGGALYSPALYQRRFAPDRGERDRPDGAARAAAPYRWYRSILARTLTAEPVLHCHGLHEWAMQYRPPGAPPPPSARYQSHLPLRVSRDVVNAAVERRGVHCTHVDALRFFAPAAGPLNHHGRSLRRTDQLRLEQPGCVHTHMDLLKMALRLQPFLDADLLGDALECALDARRLDVEASPYDASAYGLGVVPVETSGGRRAYRERQAELMERARPVRVRMLEAYDAFLGLAFEEDVLGRADRDPAPERFARAEPGGLPWRKNLIEDR